MPIVKLLRDDAANSVVFVRNYLYDRKMGRLSQRTVRFFESLVEKTSFLPGMQTSEVFHDFLEAHRDRLILKGRVLRPSRKRLCRVVNGASFLRRNVTEPKGSPLVFKRSEKSTNSQLLRSITRVEKLRRDYIKKDSELRGALPMNWVTKTKNVRGQHYSDPDQLRNCLGLVHFNQDQDICLVDYPSNFRVTLRNPTSLDGGVNYIYWSKGKGASWGETIDLKTSNGSTMPEAVHETIKLNNQFDFQYLGKLKRANFSKTLIRMRAKAKSEIKNLKDNRTCT